MIRVALRGLAGRKFRTVLTAIAIVLGVAMMSGAYVLTDTIDKAFNAIFVESYAGTDAVVSGKGADISFEGEQSEPPPIPEDVLEQVRAVDGVEVATGSVTDFQTKLLKPDGESIDTGGAPSFAFGIETAPEYDRFNPLNLVEGRWPSGSEEVAIDEGVADDENLAVGDRIGVAALGPARGVRDRRNREVRRCELARRRHVRHLRHPDRPDARGQGGPARRGAGRRAGRGRARGARRPHPGGARDVRDGAVRNRAGERGLGRGGDVHEHHPVLPAVVRGHRPVRRRLRDLQHAFDHGRAADARVRNAANGRRVSPAGAGLRDPGGAGDRPARVDHRTVRRARARGRAERALHRAQPRPAADGDGVRHPDDRRLAARGDRDHADRRALAGLPCDACAADRCRPGGRASCRARRSPASRRTSRSRPSCWPCSRSRTRCSRPTWPPATASPCSASASWRCSSAWPCSRRASSSRSPASWDGPRAASAAPPGGSPWATRSATPGARPPRRPRS